MPSLTLLAFALLLAHSLSWRSIPSTVSLLRREAVGPRSSLCASLKGNDGKASRTRSRPGSPPPPPPPPPALSSEVLQALRKEAEDVIVEQVQASQEARLVSLTWIGQRCEVVVDLREEQRTGPDGLERGLSSEELDRLHRGLYSVLEGRAHLAPLLQQSEFLVATPGVGEVLLTDRDFRSFKGFEVEVRHRAADGEEKVSTGSLVSRDDECLRLSRKGRPVVLQRSAVLEVRLHPPLFEEDDPEIHKLR
eukprot:gene10669-11836_t